MKLIGKRVKLGLIPIGGKLSTVDSMEYTMRLRTPEGRLIKADVYSIEKISSSIAHVDKRKIAEIFKIKSDAVVIHRFRLESRLLTIYVGIRYRKESPYKKSTSVTAS